MDGLISMRGFLESLVPAQARAIGRLRLEIDTTLSLNQVDLAKLGCLERLDITISLANHTNDEWTLPSASSRKGGVLGSLKRMTEKDNFNKIGKLRFKSLRIMTCEVSCDDVRPTEVDKESIVEWLEGTETRLLQSAA